MGNELGIEIDKEFGLGRGFVEEHDLQRIDKEY